MRCASGNETMKNKSEKRKNERYQCFVPVESKKGSSFEHTKTVNISKSGIGFLSPHFIPFKQKIPIEITLSPEADPVLVMGEVKWVHPLSGTKKYRVGMTFTNVLSGSRSRLGRYFHRNIFLEKGKRHG